MYKVLIVDDDMPVRKRLKKFNIWEAYGFVVEDEACNGKEALNILSAKSFDLVITDIRMPGIDGLELISKIKARNIDSCLILLSTYNDFEFAQQGIRFGVYDYITKPVDENALSKALARVRRHLEEIKSEHYRLPCRERKLTDLILTGSNTIIEEAANTIEEQFKLTDQDLFKTGLMLEKMLFNINEEISKVFPFLGTFETLNFDNACANAVSIEDISEKFLNCINKILEIFKKYDLYQPDSIVKKICQYIMTHVEEDIKLDDIANELGISQNYTGRLFKQKTGTNFSEYVTKIKMEYAKHLLETSIYKNYEISEKLGYSDPDYFCRLFKNYTGSTPMKFRKMGT